MNKSLDSGREKGCSVAHTLGKHACEKRTGGATVLFLAIIDFQFNSQNEMCLLWTPVRFISTAVNEFSKLDV